jgi:hypothetical protein
MTIAGGQVHDSKPLENVLGKIHISRRERGRSKRENPTCGGGESVLLAMPKLYYLFMQSPDRTNKIKLPGDSLDANHLVSHQLRALVRHTYVKVIF